MPLTLSLFGDTATDIPLRGVSIDSRTLQPGELFAAVRGERFDGHDFIDQAVASGCVALLAEQKPNNTLSIPVVIVPDVLRALGKAAQTWRDQVDPLVLAVTGSCGKTTVKEMLTRCLKKHFPTVHATRGNFNNHIGLPLTLLRMPENCQALVVELGMSAAGEITYLAQLARPHIGIVTNVLPAHLEAFASMDAIADAKGELLESLPDHGVAIIPFAQPYTQRLRQKAGKTKILTFGLGTQADVYFPPLPQESVSTGVFSLHWQAEGDDVKIHLGCQGEHIRQNASAVAAAARAAGLSLTQIAMGMAGFVLPAGRGGLRVSLHGWSVIDDTYNANPGSVQAALHALPQPVSSGRRIAILGDMLELGKEAIFLHRELAEAVVESGVTQLYTAGPLMKALHQAVTTDDFVSAYPTIKAWHRSDPSQWLGHIAPHLQANDVVLVKGSRGMKMERIVENLVTNAL